MLTLFSGMVTVCGRAGAAEGQPWPGYGLARAWSPELRRMEARLGEIQEVLAGLPVMTDQDAQGTHGFHSNFSPESEEHWFEIRWETPQRVDGIGMIPTRLTTQSGARSNYGLPARLRMEAELEGVSGRVVLAEVADTRLDLRRGEPLFVAVKAEAVRALRFIPMEAPTLPGKEVRFFSLAEVMVFDGRRNVTGEGRPGANFSIDGEVGWNIHYLVDGQSPLGPPEWPGVPRSLGWHADLSRGADQPTWAVVDLWREVEVEGLRLVPAQGDAPVKGPGFGFPERMGLEVSGKAEGPWREVWNSGSRDLTNPGYNPVRISFPGTRARFVRLRVDRVHAPDGFALGRVLLSEMEVLGTEGQNVALGGKVTTPDSYESIPHDATRVWSRAGLTDGFSSTGRLMPERDWVENLARRFDLICEAAALEEGRETLVRRWQTVLIAAGFGSLSAAMVALVVWQMRLRRANRRSLRALRRQMAGDLHDEVGSSLATISLLSDLGPESLHMADIHRISRETSLALRDIVELSGAPGGSRGALLPRLRETAGLMLRGQRVEIAGGEDWEVDLSQRRDLLLFFKESLHNIMRHAGAGAVEIVFEKREKEFALRISDDGCGMAEGQAVPYTLAQRAGRLGGKLSIFSKPGAGTRIELVFPIVSKK